ncbi:hypothetical protein ACQ4PT_050338 [Festuca glaucescens]
MVFKTLILSVAVLLSVLASSSASFVGEQCVPGRKIPDKPLQACHGYVARQVCGSLGHLPFLSKEVMKERCCQELSAIPKYCRCEALRILIDQMETLEVEGGRLKELTQQCPRQWQRGFAATLFSPEECNLRTTYMDPVCLNMDRQVVA